MSRSNKSKGGLYRRQFLCLILSIGIVLIGFPIGVLGQDKGIPIKLIFVEGGLTDALTAGPTGMPRGHNPNTHLRVKAILLDAKGNDVTNKCSRIWYEEYNPLSGEVVKVYPDAEGAELVIGAARGAARVTAWCENYPELQDHLLVTGNGGNGPFEPTEIRSWLEVSPLYFKFSETQRKYLEAKAKETPAPPPPEPAPTPPKTTADTGPGLGTALLVGGALAAAVAVAAAGGGNGDGSDGNTCPAGYFSCGNPVGGPACCPNGYGCCFGYNVCCPGDKPHLGKERSSGTMRCYSNLSGEGTTWDLLTVCGVPAE